MKAAKSHGISAVIQGPREGGWLTDFMHVVRLIENTKTAQDLCEEL